MPYGGSTYDGATDPTMLEGYKDNKYDTAATFGGPIIRDKLWFFGSGQYRNNSSTFDLSESASSTREEVDYAQKRTGLFGKISLKPSENDSFTFMYFLDDYSIEGSRSVNTIKSRQPMYEYDYGTWSAYYQRVYGENLIVDLRYGHYSYGYKRGPRYTDEGIPDSLYYMADDYPSIENYTFGGYPSANDDFNTRDQFSLNAELYMGNMRFKAGVMYSNEYDKDDSYYYFGENRSSVDPSLSGATLGDFLDWGIWPPSEMDELLLPYMNNNWGPILAISWMTGGSMSPSPSMLELESKSTTILTQRNLLLSRCRLGFCPG
jgi:hypothetical protein